MEGKPALHLAYDACVLLIAVNLIVSPIRLGFKIKTYTH